MRERLIRFDEGAKRLGYHPQHLRKLIKQGKVKPADPAPPERAALLDRNLARKNHERRGRLMARRIIILTPVPAGTAWTVKLLKAEETDRLGNFRTRDQALAAARQLAERKDALVIE